MKPAEEVARLVTMMMSWHGDALQIGAFLKSPRGKVAYEICAIRRVKSKLPSLGRGKYALSCRRWEPKEGPPHATMFEFTWNKRSRR